MRYDFSPLRPQQGIVRPPSPFLTTHLIVFKSQEVLTIGTVYAQFWGTEALPMASLALLALRPGGVNLVAKEQPQAKTKPRTWGGSLLGILGLVRAPQLCLTCTPFSLSYGWRPRTSSDPQRLPGCTGYRAG